MFAITGQSGQSQYDKQNDRNHWPNAGAERWLTGMGQNPEGRLNMPIESQKSSSVRCTEASVGEAFLSETRQTLAGSIRKIENGFDQLSDEDIWWRQHESHNSIQNIVLHLCGNEWQPANAEQGA
jgi:hypothetical protein